MLVASPRRREPVLERTPSNRRNCPSSAGASGQSGPRPWHCPPVVVYDHGAPARLLLLLDLREDGGRRVREHA
eukprot:3145891-Heterocapsa_arctica.AAC.1